MSDVQPCEVNNLQGHTDKVMSDGQGQNHLTSAADENCNIEKIVTSVKDFDLPGTTVGQDNVSISASIASYSGTEMQRNLPGDEETGSQASTVHEDVQSTAVAAAVLPIDNKLDDHVTAFGLTPLPQSDQMMYVDSMFFGSTTFKDTSTICEQFSVSDNSSAAEHCSRPMFSPMSRSCCFGQSEDASITQSITDVIRHEPVAPPDDMSFVDQLLASVLKRAQEVDMEDIALDKFKYEPPSSYRNDTGEPVSSSPSASVAPTYSAAGLLHDISSSSSNQAPVSELPVGCHVSGDSAAAAAAGVSDAVDNGGQTEEDAAERSAAAAAAMKTFNLVMRLQRKVADMQMEMTRLQDTMRATNTALQEVIGHLYAQMGWK